MVDTNEEVELLEIENIANLLYYHFGIVTDGEKTTDWYVGTTSDGLDDEFKLARIRSHYNNGFPSLVKESIQFMEVSSNAIAFTVEKKLASKGFTVGNHPNKFILGARVYVYLFKK